CVPQPTGHGPRPQNDTPSAFHAYPAFSLLANNASTPPGYIKTFTDLHAANNAYGYMGYTLLPSYSPTLCASKCTSIPGCQSFNLYFERNPLLIPNHPTCLSPPSTTNIKCVFWGSPVSASNALNTGQYQGNFTIVIAGSTGYVNHTIATPTNYTPPVYLGHAAIQAPPPCFSSPSRLLQSHVFIASTFDIALCATACTEQALWATGREGQRPCSFFDTHVLYRSGVPVGQYCALYEEAWGELWAINKGYYFGKDHYTLGFSYSSA
ncbi:hypothetical protein K461DRAFT_207541, partial [Myriangium duriaei CBS 260.36]